MKLAIYLLLAIFAVLVVSLNAEDNEATVDDYENEAANPIEDEEDQDDDDDDQDEDDEVLPKKSPGWFWRRRRRSPPTTPPEKRCKAPRRKGNQVCSMDGCSFKWAPFFFVNLMFKKACDEHDCCYQFKTCSRKDCDRAFKANMLKSCSKRTRYCASNANLYYLGVRMFGWTSYGKVRGK